MSRYLPQEFAAACLASPDSREQSLEERFAAAKSDFVVALREYQLTKISQPDAAWNEAERRMAEIESELDALGAELAE
ncbi:hypothetical protein M2212_003116 [Bradyrhizobium elkanii]|uniref:hypothetical protein n=1 Tax=Bradyrhizobium elkanii TaxID=29448 RepID=UPI002169247E|nr:hypothetical protein [Bradyrhizobium elkanii]MCS3476270.1 hypothetical protein [Bradyrhizobium elkanii]MCS3686659.1 hypothetical protein [Bradyrhizobium elkanii]